MIKAMVGVGHKVSLVLCDLPYRNKVKSLDGVKVYFFKIKPEILALAAISRFVFRISLYDLLCTRLGLFRSLGKRIQDITHRDRIELICCENFLAALPVSNVITGVPIIVTIHDVMTENFMQKAQIYKTPELFTNLALSYYEETRLRGLQSADAYVCVTERDADRFQAMGVPRGKLFIIPMGTYTSKIVSSPKKPELLKGLGIKESDPVLFFCGTEAFNNNKAAENIIKIVLPRIIQHLPRAKVLFAGGVCNYI